LLHPLHHPDDHVEPLVLVKGEGAVVWDAQGREFLDGLAGLWNTNVGHGRKELAEAGAAQMSTLAFSSGYIGSSNVPAIELSTRLSQLAYPSLNTVFFTSGGAESNESAFKTARFYWKAKGKPEKIKVISDKLEKGIANFSADERQNLLTDLDRLEKLLIENEGKFYQNQSDYRLAINELREKYFDIQSLESRLSDSEKQRGEEQRIYNQRILFIAGVLIAFGALIILLISFSARVRKQAKALKMANEEIQTINENLEAIVIKRTKLLEETNRELDTFLYRASHDLRSPIRSILGLCNIIDSIPSSELLARMKGTTLGMDRMLKKLIYISEISQQSSNISTVQVSTSIQEVKSRLEETIRDTGVKINVECPENITIRTSPALLENILTNLVENAIFFSMIKDSHHAQVDIKAIVKGNAMEISVYDNGVGIEEAIRPRLFDMFFTGHEKAKGNGLGLYAVQKSVTALYGKVHVESEVGHYSRISVLIPHS
jgi:signal transduction histidine kinase